MKQIIPNKYIYHVSNPIFRNKIKKHGLIPRGKSEGWLEDTPIRGKVIFATNSEDPEDWFNSTYDDDIYQIDTSKIDNKWYEDPNFIDVPIVKFDKQGNKYNSEYYHIYTRELIPLNAIKLIHKGTGKDKLNRSNKILLRKEFMHESNLIKGGKGDKTNIKDLDPKEFKIGILVELEHTNDRKKATEIATDHLTENPKYYSKLIKAGLCDEKRALKLAVKFGWIKNLVKESLYKE